MSTPYYFTLDADHTVCATSDFSRWLDWMRLHNGELDLAETIYPHCHIHTSFLGSDLEEHDAQDGPQPFLTVIVGGPHDGKSVGAATWAQAHDNHARISELLAFEACQSLATDEPSPFLE